MRCRAPGGHCDLVSPNRPVRSVRVSCLALLVVALGTGVPVGGHTHHHEIERHVGAQGHGHGLVLVQQDMRVEPAGAAHFEMRETPKVHVGQPPLRLIADLPACDGSLCDSRAPPPDNGPRAPPL